MEHLGFFWYIYCLLINGILVYQYRFFYVPLSVLDAVVGQLGKEEIRSKIFTGHWWLGRKRCKILEEAGLEQRWVEKDGWKGHGLPSKTPNNYTKKLLIIYCSS